MTKIIGVRFRNVGKVYYFDPKDYEVSAGDHVIVETARGVEYGTVVLAPREVEDSKVVQPLKEVIRVATDKDTEREQSNRSKEREAFDICKKKIIGHELDMKLIDAEYTFDNNKVLFYFTADGRIDFRELVKDLASVFKTRIELRQIGVRDETKILGGMGICGRPLCCHTYLSEFVPVSIKMAKEQNLSLNPTKISGTCGRLMCCLKNEQETYEYLNKSLPNHGDIATTPEGLVGEVQTVNVLRQQVRVLVHLENDEKEIQEFPVEELEFIPKQKFQGNLTNVQSPKKETAAEDSRENNEGNKEKNRNNGGRNQRQGQNAEQGQRQRQPQKQEQRPRQPQKQEQRPRQNPYQNQNPSQGPKPGRDRSKEQRGENAGEENRENRKNNRGNRNNRRKNRGEGQQKRPEHAGGAESAE